MLSSAHDRRHRTTAFSVSARVGASWGESMTEAPFRVLPQLSADNEFFWTSGREGVLRFLQCVSCSYFIHPPTPICPKCYSREVAPSVVSGRGTLFSFTVNHKSWDGSPDPYTIGLVQLDEQDDLRLTTNIVGCAPDDVRIGVPVEVVFEDRDPIFIPLFRPVP